MSSFRFGVLALSLCLSGCVSSIHPLSPLAGSKPDVRLLGEWKYDKPGDTNPSDSGIAYVTVKGHGLHFHFVPTVVKGDKNPDKPTSYDGFTTLIDSNSFLNIKVPLESKEGDVYQFYRYSVDADGGVKVWNISHDEVSDAIRSKILKSDIPDSNPNKQADITLTDSSDNLMKFIKSSDVKKLFPDVFAEFYLVKPGQK
jgi:hypothetical protein